ncbi:MAG: hypothetical protein AB7F35_24960 [Acetobacteraceae bacterium]
MVAVDQQQEDQRIAAYRDSGLFDVAWYKIFYPDINAAGIDPLLHFARFGMAEGRLANRYFDPSWYLRTNPDVSNAQLDPFIHYWRHGDQEGRRPHPYFDAGWYRSAYGLAADTPALPHFLANRRTGRFIPCPELYPVTFQAPYRDDPALGVDPFGHYLDDIAGMGKESSPELGIIAPSGLVDANYYLINASDVYEAELDPTVHYCRFGWREHRRPNIYFDIGWYLQTNPVLARLKVNPLIHYILEGEPRNRRSCAYFDPEWYRATYDVPPGQTALAHYLAHRRSQTVSPNPLFDVKWYVKQHQDVLGPNRDPFAHYLQAGTTQDIDPSPQFDAAKYRREHLGRPSKSFRHMLRPDQDNPLVHYLRSTYT